MTQAALALFFLLDSIFSSCDSGREISFHSLVWDLLPPGLVHRIEVINRDVERGYLKSSPTLFDSSVAQPGSDTTSASPDWRMTRNNDYDGDIPHYRV